MRIKLINFRCYENAEFDFGDNGITLLSGSSGTGKSTLLMAIDFALSGKAEKIFSHGKKTCLVELEIGDLKIVRKRGPKHLLVNDIYEDMAGESVIQEKFGKVFSFTSYIQQNMKESFLLLTPADKLKFLEKIAFNGVDISEINSRAKAVVNERQLEHTKTLNNLEFAIKMLSETVKPAKVEFPIKASSATAREKIIKNQEVKFKNTCTLIKRTEREIKTLESEMANVETLLAVLGEKEKMLLEYSQKLDGLIVNKCSILYIGDDKLQQLKHSLGLIIKQKEYTQLKLSCDDDYKRLEMMKACETEENRRNLKDIDDRLWKDIPKEEIDEEIKTWNSVVDNKRHLARALKELNTISATIGVDKTEDLNAISTQIKEHEEALTTLKLRKDCMECPHCMKMVKIDKDGKLAKVDVTTSMYEPGEMLKVQSILQNLNLKYKEISKDVEKFKTKRERVRVLEDEISSINSELKDVEDGFDADSHLKSLIAYKSENTSLEHSRIIYANFKFSPSILTLETKNKSDKQKLTTMVCTQVYENEEELRKTIFQETRNCENIQRINSNIVELETLIAKLKIAMDTIQRDHMEKYGGSVKTSESIVDMIREKENFIMEQQAKQAEVVETQKKIEEFQIYETKFGEWQKLNTHKKDLEALEIINRKRYTSACIFRDKIAEAESIAIGNMIDNINTRAHIYLECFFPDTPINVRIATFKEGKSESKPQINIEIDYKGIEYDLNMLSGGEVSRVVLAFTLAFSEIYNSPLILLDESTSSLDQELTGSVVEGIKENFGDKLIILIAHQVVQGVFDKIIKL